MIITNDGGPLADHDGLGVIVFETEASAATFLMPRERIEWWSDDRLAQWSEMDRQTGPS